MVVDTSALVPILLGEPDAARLEETIIADPGTVMSAATYVEFGMLAQTRRGFDVATIDAALDRWKIEIVPVSPSQARLAVRAFIEYGKGRHPARLNYGDCFAYALTRKRDEPLLFKGDDFPLTDVATA